MPHRKKGAAKRKKKLTQSISVPQEVSSCSNNIKSPNGSCIQYVNRQDISGLSKILCPFSNFCTNTDNSNKRLLKIPLKGTYAPTGLSSKEKSYVISSCSTKYNNYAKLKSHAARAIQKNKIFSIGGNNCNAVRKALLDRGWVEKISANKMNLNKIRNGTYSSQSDIQNELERLLLSNFVEKYHPNFIWRTRDDRHDNTIDMKKDYNTIINKLEIDAVWTTKHGLCSSIKRNYWFFIDGVAEVNAPRSYDASENGEIESFVKDYKITTCTSLLKWIVSMVANEVLIFDKRGTVSIKVIIFALNRCKEYLYQKQNKDIDQQLTQITDKRWNSFLKKYYCVIAKDEIFKSDNSQKMPLYISYAKLLLKEIYKYRPQLSCEGCHNIWIIKPGHNSRGRGIRMASKLGVIIDLLNKSNYKHVIQKYIEEPLLIYETKFDIRQYYLVTSTYPLVIWMYKDCYLKFSSQMYNLKDYHESIHLTNNAVQRRYSNCKFRHSELPNNNMWDLEKYKKYLNKTGNDNVWDNIIYPGMKKSIISIMLSSQDYLSFCKNRFELYGCDFILDKEYKPWLIEINSCPDLNNTTQVTAKICPAVVSDIIKVVIDRANNPTASTGKFECIYRQPIAQPRYITAGELMVRGVSLRNDYFYKGNIQTKQSFIDPEIGTQNDVEAILEKLKQAYDADAVMIQPENDVDTGTKFDEESVSTLSANENNELQELNKLDQLTIRNSESKVSICSRKQSKCNIQNVDSVTNLLFISNSNNGLNSTDIQQNFRFSELDDGPNGKASIIYSGLSEREKLDLECSVFCNKTWNGYINGYLNTQKQESLSLTNFINRENVVLATSKIISFINEKEKEYLNMQ